jgi:hypothetical protein
MSSLPSHAWSTQQKAEKNYLWRTEERFTNDAHMDKQNDVAPSESLMDPMGMLTIKQPRVE